MNVHAQNFELLGINRPSSNTPSKSSPILFNPFQLIQSSLGVTNLELEDGGLDRWELMAVRDYIGSLQGKAYSIGICGGIGDGGGVCGSGYGSLSGVRKLLLTYN